MQQIYLLRNMDQVLTNKVPSNSTWIQSTQLTIRCSKTLARMAWVGLLLHGYTWVCSLPHSAGMLKISTCALSIIFILEHPKHGIFIRFQISSSDICFPVLWQGMAFLHLTKASSRRSTRTPSQRFSLKSLMFYSI